MLLGCLQHSKPVRNSAPPKASRIPPWGNSNNNRAHDWSSEPAFLPLALPSAVAHTQRCGTGYPPAVIGEPGLVRAWRRSKEEWGREGNKGEKRWSSATVHNKRPKICSGWTVSSSSDYSALMAPAEVGSISASSVFFFLLPVPCSINSGETGDSMLVYRDSCSTAGCHDGVPPWIAALSQQYVQMSATEFSMNTAEDQNPDGWWSLVKETGLSQGIIHIHAGALTCTFWDTQAVWVTAINLVKWHPHSACLSLAWHASLICSGMTVAAILCRCRDGGY